MRHELWRAILTTRGDIDRQVAAAVGDYPKQAPPRPMAVRRPPPRPPSGPQLVRAAGGAAAAVPQRMTTAQDTARLWVDPAQSATAPGASLEHDALRRLHDDVHARVETLRAQLAAEPGGEQAMLALVLYFDEHIMGQLPEFLATSWPLLQTRLTGRNTGGADFFRLIDRLLEAEAQPGFVLEAYYFCLASGFRGQYAADPAALEGYRQRLRARIPAPEPARQPPPVATASPAPIRSPALYYVAAAALIVIFTWGLTVWSNQ
ncbi:MAG TPA: DotU family type IV/VI secretion system protein [Kofleriaceae bacterium]|jgi:type IV/VI secretion system ImpK/VasF family protein|nr:DotU family type IV/VI secretion system protein [Kofleriaceae bacterium]